MVGSTRTLHGHWDILLSRHDVVNSASLNSTTAQILSSSSAKILKYRPKICFIEGGANDLIMDVNIPEIEQNIRFLVDTLKARSVLPVIELNVYSASDTILNKRIDSLNASLIALSQQTGAEYIDLNPVLCENGFLQKKYAKEPLLLTPAAYPFWAIKVGQLLNKLNMSQQMQQDKN